MRDNMAATPETERQDGSNIRDNMPVAGRQGLSSLVARGRRMREKVAKMPRTEH